MKVTMKGYFTLAKTHPLLSSASEFLLTLLGPKIYQFVTLQIEDSSGNDDDENMNEFQDINDEIDNVVEEYGKQDRNTILSALSLGGLKAKSFIAPIGPLRLRDGKQPHKRKT